MDRTPEEELNFLRLDEGEDIQDDIYFANVYMQRQMDLLGIVVEASVKEMEKMRAETSPLEAKASKRYQNLLTASEIAFRHHQILTAVNASVVAAIKMIALVEKDFPTLFPDMSKLIELYPDLLEKRAMERSLEANDKSPRTASLRHHLNSLLEGS